MVLKGSIERSDEPLSGRCLCGSICYQVDEIEPRIGHCHCSMCRKFHGSAFSTFAEAKSHNFHWVQGRELLVDYIAENGTVRQFCKKCGSSLTFRSADNSQGFVEFSLGTLDSTVDLYPDAHIHVSSKVSWFDVDDDLPQFQLGRDS